MIGKLVGSREGIQNFKDKEVCKEGPKLSGELGIRSFGNSFIKI